MKLPRLYLASKSPRRKQLLQRLGFSVIVIPQEISEEMYFNQSPEETVLSLSREKAEKAIPFAQKGLIVSADTVVVLEGKILGKPKSSEEAISMLKRLSGKIHKVYTGFTIIDNRSKKEKDLPWHSAVECTRVKFRKLEEWEIKAYVASGSPMDKAGGYGIQDSGGFFVKWIDGCYYNVVGFPIPLFYQGLKKFLDKQILQQIMRGCHGVE